MKTGKRMKIICTTRPNDVMAKLEGQTGVWGAGRSAKEAIGDMVTAHYDIFNVEVEWPMAKQQPSGDRKQDA